MKKVKGKVWGKFLAALMLYGMNHDKYGKLRWTIQEKYVRGTNEYPESNKVVLILNAYVPTTR